MSTKCKQQIHTNICEYLINRASILHVHVSTTHVAILREDASPANIQFHVLDCRQSGQHRILSIPLHITFHSFIKHMSHVFTENDILTHTLHFIISGTPSRVALSCWLRHYDPSKRQQIFANRHGIAAQKTRISSPLKMSRCKRLKFTVPWNKLTPKSIVTKLNAAVSLSSYYKSSNQKRPTSSSSPVTG
jgi:hypothetical protein